MFQRFTDKCIHIIMIAQKEARNLGHNRVGTEQILLGLAAAHRSPTSYWLDSAGFPIDQARARVKQMIGAGSDFVEAPPPFSWLMNAINMFRPMPLTENAISLMQRSIEEADRLGNNDVEPQHMLLAVLKFHESRAARLLALAGVQAHALERKVLASAAAK
ncbi:MAG TPA: Clp protease N-terminal domain-containing protein [Trichormus sp.]|jgi:ATP-dependent Clp protease ATP-binding subunit ClpC